MVKSIVIVLVFLYSSISTAIEYQTNTITVGHGRGIPKHIIGNRITYGKTLITKNIFQFYIEGSYSHWTTHAKPKQHLDIFAIAPVFRLIETNYNGLFNIYFEGSIGFARKSKKSIGFKQTGHYFDFQDFITLGCQINKKLDLRLQYIHYSNAGFFPPNPGIDIRPMLSIGYNW